MKQKSLNTNCSKIYFSHYLASTLQYDIPPLVNNAITIVVRHANFTFLSLYSIYTSLNIKILFPLTACLWQSTYVFNLRWLIKNNFLKKYRLGKIVTQLLMVLMYVVSRKGKIRNWTFKIYSFNIIEMGSVKIRMQSWFQHHVILHNLISFMWMFSRSLSFWPLCCLFFFDLRILITLLISSNSS